jgi:catechol 2,3-dioxygenase-like lactoylglutathione lyase family enzyme
MAKLAGARLTTLIPIKNMDRAIKFYTKALGGKVLFRGDGTYARLNLGGDEVWLVSPGKWEKRTLAYSVFQVKSIKTFVNGLKRHGVKFERAQRMGPESKVDGPIAYESFGASAFFKDSEGNLLMVWQTILPT